jgi:hypothetical protein
MRRQLTIAARLLTFCWLLAPAVGTAQSTPGPTAPASGAATTTVSDQAALLVDQALAAEAAGKLGERDTLLARAIETAPKYARAHWAARHVRQAGKWLPIEQAETVATADPKRAQYESMKLKEPANLDGEQALAIWCGQHRMEEEAKWHWRNVLNYDATNHRAMKELGLHAFNGTLLTTEQQNAAIREAKAFEAAAEVWRARLMRWRHDLAGKNEERRQGAIAHIREIDDPEVVLVFESLFQPKLRGDDSSTFSTEMVRVLSKLSHPKVTGALVRQAILSPWEETRKAATEALASRELGTYVPEAMKLTGMPMDRVSKVTWDQEGTVYYEQQLFSPGPLAENIHVDRSVFTLAHLALLKLPVPWPGRVPPAVAIAQDHELALQMAAEKNEQDQLDMERRNQVLANQNSSVIELLKANSGTDCGNSIEPWWEWWRNFNELGEKSEAPQYSYGTTHYYDATVPCCFGKGTKVSTLTGLVAIEKILPGDRVLAQNPQTGELGYKLVLLTSVRPPSPMRKLTIDGEEIPTTRGHRFWQVGRGWQMSKQLETGVQLYTCAAPAAIDRVEDIDDDQAYNLVVDGFHTYFVGEHRLLVHDNSAPLPVLGPVPGLQTANR